LVVSQAAPTSILGHTFPSFLSFGPSNISANIEPVMEDLKDLKAADMLSKPRDSMSAESQDDRVVSAKKGTAEDQKDMQRMGKVQELRRNFRFVSIFGYSMILMATWETVLT
jgi:hypothetical protein